MNVAPPALPGRCPECARLVPSGSELAPLHYARGRVCAGSQGRVWIPNGPGADLALLGPEPEQMAQDSQPQPQP